MIKPKPGEVSFKLTCKCGTKEGGTIQEYALDSVVETFVAGHKGEGHKPKLSATFVRGTKKR